MEKALCAESRTVLIQELKMLMNMKEELHLATAKHGYQRNIVLRSQMKEMQRGSSTRDKPDLFAKGPRLSELARVAVGKNVTLIAVRILTVTAARVTAARV